MRTMTASVVVSVLLGFLTVVAAQRTPSCEEWNTKEYFQTATVENMTACLDAGADLEAREVDGVTPLHWAAMFNANPAVLKALLAAGADPMTRDEDGFTPLHLAARDNENPAVIAALVDSGADLKVRTGYGFTPLHLTTSLAVITALLDAGADPMARNAAGETPWDLAKGNKALKRSDAYWRLNDARFEAPGGGAHRSPTKGQTPTSDKSNVELAAAVPSSGPGCLIPGYPSPPGGVANLGFSWCPASVTLQVRSFALQAAGAQCAIAGGSSSTPEQIQARRQEINAACDRLAALGAPNCQCPPGLRP